MFLFCLMFVMPLCASVYLCLVATAGKGLTSWISFVVYNCHFPIGILGHVWYLFVSIPDLCTLTYFESIRWCVCNSYHVNIHITLFYLGFVK